MRLAEMMKGDHPWARRSGMLQGRMSNARSLLRLAATLREIGPEFGKTELAEAMQILDDTLKECDEVDGYPSA